MQACARIGAIHSVVFGGFSAKSVNERIVDAGARLVITADGQMPRRQGDRAQAGGRRGAGDGRLRARSRASSSTAAPAATSPGTTSATSGGTTSSPACRTTARPTPVEAEHPLFILYTSGSTGKPKGVQHSTGGYLLQAVCSMKWTFDIKTSDVFWCTADVGWVTGHTYVAYGPLAVGGTQVMFEGVPTYPQPVAVLGDDPAAQGHDLLHGAHGDPLADQARAPTCRSSSTCRACGCWARSASRSTPRRGCGTTRTSAARAAPSSTPGGRPRPAAT